MKRLELMNRVRSLTRDFNKTAFRDLDVIAYINEGVGRMQQIIPQLNQMIELTYDEAEPIVLPKSYHHLLAVYCSSRLFAQDERFHQASTLMNEFETKMNELLMSLTNGELVAKNPDGTTVDVSLKPFYVKNNYFDMRNKDYDKDEGVEGVPY